MDNGASKHVLATFGFGEDGRVREMFCADFKAGTGVQVLVMDACVMASTILQHGQTAKQLSAMLTQGPSLIGALVAEAARIDKDRENS